MQGQQITPHIPTVDEYLESIIAIANECRKSLSPAVLARVNSARLLRAAWRADSAVETVLSLLVDTFEE